MLLSAPFHLVRLPILTFCLLLCESVNASPDNQYVSYTNAIYIWDPQPTAASPPSAPAIPPSTAPYSAAVSPACPANTLSCDTIGEPSWCCTSTQRCAFDDGGDVACCPLGEFCKGTVSYGASAGSGGSSSSGEDSGGTGSSSQGSSSGGGSDVTAGSSGTTNQGGPGQGVVTAGEGPVLWDSNGLRSRGRGGSMKWLGIAIVVLVSSMAVW